MGIVSVVVVVAVFDFFRSRPAWEMFAKRLQSNGKSGFSFELQKQKQRCTKSENLPASDRLADHRCSSVWLSPPTSFYCSKVRKFEDVGINCPQVDTSRALDECTKRFANLCVQLSSLKIVKVNKLIETKSNYMKTQLISVSFGLNLTDEMIINLCTSTNDISVAYCT